MFRAFSDAIKIGRENREVFYRAIRRYMREDNPQLLENFTTRTIISRQPASCARPLEEALDLDIQDMVVSVTELREEKLLSSSIRRVERSWSKGMGRSRPSRVAG